MQSVAYLFLVARKQFLKLLDSSRGQAESPTSVSLFWQYDETPAVRKYVSRSVNLSLEYGAVAKLSHPIPNPIPIPNTNRISNRNPKANPLCNPVPKLRSLFQTWGTFAIAP